MSKRAFRSFVNKTLKVATGKKSKARLEAIRLLAAMALAQEYAKR